MLYIASSASYPARFGGHACRRVFLVRIWIVYGRRAACDRTRAARGAAAAGLRVASIKIGRDGGIEILTVEAAPEVTDAFSEWKARRDARRSQGN
jgi:hypothetical protein